MVSASPQDAYPPAQIARLVGDVGDQLTTADWLASPRQCWLLGEESQANHQAHAFAVPIRLRPGTRRGRDRGRQDGVSHLRLLAGERTQECRDLVDLFIGEFDAELARPHHRHRLPQVP